MDIQVERALARIAAELDADRIALMERHRDGHAADVTYAWIRPGIPPVPASVDWSEFPWMARRVGEGHVVVASPRQPLPAEAETDGRSMLTRGIQSMLAVPLVLEGAVVGVLSRVTGRPARE
jgi:GAF domain-containing protein